MLDHAQVWTALVLGGLSLCVMLWGFGYRMGKLMTCLDQVATQVGMLGEEVKKLAERVSHHEKKIAVTESKVKALENQIDREAS